MDAYSIFAAIPKIICLKIIYLDSSHLQREKTNNPADHSINLNITRDRDKVIN